MSTTTDPKKPHVDPQPDHGKDPEAPGHNKDPETGRPPHPTPPTHPEPKK
jgi:hypothetical protein